MLKIVAAFSIVFIATSVMAQEPSEEVKTWALKRAYELNGNSMTGCKVNSDADWTCHGMDVSADVYMKFYAPPPEKNALDDAADVPVKKKKR